MGGRGREGGRRWSAWLAGRPKRPCSPWSWPAASGGVGGGCVAAAQSSSPPSPASSPPRTHCAPESSHPPHASRGSYQLVSLPKSVQSADKLPSRSLVLLPISIPRPLPTFQPFQWHRLHSRTLATRYQSNRAMKGHNDGTASRVTSKQVYVRLLLSCRLYSVNWGSVWKPGRATRSGRAPTILPPVGTRGGSGGSSGAAALSKWEN